jgi:cell division protein FtsB
MNFWVLVYRFAWMVVIAFCVMALVCFFLPKTHNYQALQKRKMVLEQGNALIESKVRQLQQNEKRFQSDPAFVERVAREHGMAMPGETIFRFPSTNTITRSRRP